MANQEATLDVTNGLLTLDEIVTAALQVIQEHGRVGFNYLRISDDPEGLEHGVVAQNEDTREKAASEQTPILRGFCDNDLSASTLATKPRSDYELMREVVAALPKNTVRIYPYSNSRLTRRPSELEDWIKAFNATGVLIKTVVSGEDDLSTADGRMVARIKADVDAAEAERTSERVKRRIRQFRENGVSGPGGSRPFGYERGGESLREVEAEAIRVGAQILLDGGTVGDVIRKWTADGIRPVRAEVWHRRTVQGIFRSPRIAGLLEWDGNLLESKNSPGILDRPTWTAVKECLKPKDMGRDPSWWQTKNLLSGLVTCGGCGRSMKAKGQHYGCLSSRGGCGKTYRNKQWVESLVSELVDLQLEKLPGGEQKSEQDEKIEATTAEIERLESVIRETLAAVRNGDLPSADGFPLVASARKDVEDLQRVATAEIKDRSEKLPASTALTLWRSPDLEKRRRALSAAIETVIIYPLDKRDGYGRHRKLPHDSVEVVWSS